jgi:hypothetical protein
MWPSPTIPLFKILFASRESVPVYGKLFMFIVGS